MKSDTLVIVPTYNEAKNIDRLIRKLMTLPLKVDVLVVDDGSKDGTQEEVETLQAVFVDRVHLLQRGRKLGLGTAYIAGFRYALKHDYLYICEMDADFSHDPLDIPRLVETVRTGLADVAIGSRYCQGISIINWPLSRLILSYSANLYARIVTGLPVYDCTAGFKCIRRDVLEKIDLNRMGSNGYSFQIEIHFRAWMAGFRLREVSIIFRERQEGVSKMSKNIVYEAIWKCISLKGRALLGRL